VAFPQGVDDAADPDPFVAILGNRLVVVEQLVVAASADVMQCDEREFVVEDGTAAGPSPFCPTTPPGSSSASR
jgi:hypothetical protein